MTGFSSRLMSRHVCAAAVLVCLTVATPSPAEGQLSSVGAAQLLSRNDAGSAAIKGTDSGYDPGNDVYLVVGSCYGGSCPSVLGAVYGVFVNRVGARVQGPFSIHPGGSEGHFPRVRYSRDINGGQGGFLVTWLEEGSRGANPVRARMVAYPGVLLGSMATLNSETSYAWIESAAAVGYSPVSQRFLVAWRTYPHISSPAHLAVRLVDINGVPVESAVKLSAGFARDPGVTWSAATNTFGVSFGAENSAGTAGFSGFAVVPPVNAAAFTRNSFNQITGFTYISDVDYNPDSGRFVMIWHQYTPGVPFEVRAAEIGAQAEVVTTGMVSRQLPGYDAHALAFNPVSRTFGLSSIDANDDIVALELNGRGVRTSAVTMVGPGVTGRYPRISANADFPEWNVSFSNGFLSVNNLTFATTSTNGGPDGSNPPPDGSGAGDSGSTGGCTTVKPVSDWVCVNGGWVPPSSGGGSTGDSGSTGGCTTVKPVSDWVCINGGWVPPSSGGGSTGGGSTSGCTSPQPGADWICSNGAWLPPGSGGSSGGGSTSGCTSPQPGADWICSNGAWLPPGSGGSSSGGSAGCSTAQPGAGWTCSNGNWLPPTTSSSCTTAQPGAGWTCSNGNWLPPTTTCTTPKPGTNWVCVNGGWIPGAP